MRVRASYSVPDSAGLMLVLVALTVSTGIIGNPVPVQAEPTRAEVSFEEVANLLAPDGDFNDHFGHSVSISGDTVVVSANEDDDLGPGSGSAYVFERDAGGPSGWLAVAKLRASDGEERSEFGSSVAISGDTIVVGAKREHPMFDSGAAYVFERSADDPNSWVEVAKLKASDEIRSDAFGASVAISDDTIVVGTDFQPPGVVNGSAYIFERDVGGPDAWGEVAKLVASDGESGDEFGSSVAISGDTVVVGASSDDSPRNSGSAYVFERDADDPNKWLEVAKLLASDAAEHDFFGRSVSIRDDTVVVGAPFWDGLFGSEGSAYIFERDVGGPDAWEEVAKLVASDGTADDRFGESVGIHGDTAVVGAIFDDDLGSNSGSTYIFERDAGGPNNWGETAKLLASDGAESHSFGNALAISGETLVVASGLRTRRCDVTNCAAYIFQDGTSAPFLDVSGTCPGTLNISAEGLTPNDSLAVIGAPSEGSFVLQTETCQGTELSLDSPILLTIAPTDETGAFSTDVTAPPSACGAFLQVLDIATCTPSNVDQVP